jgi:hypothetical protein
MNEQEVKSGKATTRCSDTNQLCQCTDTCKALDAGLGSPTAETARWTRAAICRIDILEGDIERALTACQSQRGYPGPELREAARLAAALADALEGCL